MSMVAAGAYLWHVREARKISRETVAAHIRERTQEGTNSVQMMRIEKGQPTSAITLSAFIEAIDADFGEVMRLLLSSDVSTDQAVELAAAHIRRASGTPDERERRRQEAIRLIDELLADPRKLERLLGYAQRLAEE